MFMRRNRPQSIQEASWWEERCVRRQGGYDLDMSNLPQDVRWLPKGTVYKFDASTGGAKVVKTCKVITEVAGGETKLEVAPNHLLNVGDVLGYTLANTITIASITHGTGKDTLTVSSPLDAIKANTVLTDLKATDVVLGFGYETLDVLYRDSNQTVTPTLRVEEVEEATLPYFINDEIKDAINKYGYARFRII